MYANYITVTIFKNKNEIPVRNIADFFVFCDIHYNWFLNAKRLIDNANVYLFKDDKDNHFQLTIIELEDHTTYILKRWINR